MWKAETQNTELFQSQVPAEESQLRSPQNSCCCLVAAVDGDSCP